MDREIDQIITEGFTETTCNDIHTYGDDGDDDGDDDDDDGGNGDEQEEGVDADDGEIWSSSVFGYIHPSDETRGVCVYRSYGI